MYKLNYRKRFQILKHVEAGKPIKKVAEVYDVSRVTVHNIRNNYKQHGLKGLEDKKTGRPKQTLNPRFYDMLIEAWHKNKGNATKLEKYFKRFGFAVPHNKIHQTLEMEGLSKIEKKKRKQRKWVRYEYPNNNDMWHTDWFECPFKGKWLTAYEDDHSRFITAAIYFKNATAANSITCFKVGIKKHDKPIAVLTDQGTQYKPSLESRKTRGQFDVFCDAAGIKHILSRVNHPQTNGKIERWFGTYKQEYDERFSSLKDFVKFYNFERLHQSLDYLTPSEVYLGYHKIPFPTLKGRKVVGNVSVK